jgi:hypothetical protein
MSFWHEHSLADARQAELRRQAEARHRTANGRPAIASVRSRVGTRPKSTPVLRQRLGILLVEAGLHLITVTDGGRPTPPHGAAGTPRAGR